MKFRIEIDGQTPEVEVVIKASQMTDEIAQIQKLLTQVNLPSLVFHKADSEYFINLSEILFFETDGPKIYGHTRDDAYEVKLKLYELEDILPKYFCRVAKPTIVNIRAIYAINKSFSGSSTVAFHKTHKQVHVSRHYYQFLKERIKEMR